MEIFFDAIIGTVAGVVATFVAIILSHGLIAARVIFSHDIRSRWNKSLLRYEYSIRIKKTGFIDLIDTHIQCRVGILDPGKRGSEYWNFYNVPTTFERNLIFGRNARFVELKFHDSRLMNARVNPDFVNNTLIRIPEVGLRAEDIFMSHDISQIRLFLLGHDRVTGVKKVFGSQRYFLRDIRFGIWQGMTVVEGKGTPLEIEVIADLWKQHSTGAGR